jgi:hypothetical protein
MPARRRDADLCAMRRLLALLALTALAAVAAGCSGRDAQEAQALLAQSEQALAKVRSATFSAKLWTEGGPQQFSFTMSGGAYAKGKQAGDFYVVMRSSDELFGDLVLVQQGGRMSAKVGGAVMSEQLPFAAPDQSPTFVELEPYVKDVRVEHGKLLGGESTTKITGVVDTQAFLEGSLGGLSQMAGLGEGGFDVGDAIGDIRAVFYLSETSRLPVRALVDLPIDILGEEVVLHMDFAYTSFDRKLDFPDV